MNRIADLPEPARGLASAMIAWYDLRELRRDPRHELELPEHGISVDLYGFLDGCDAEVLGLLRLGAAWAAVHTDGLRIGENLLEYPEGHSVCLLHQVAWRRGLLLVPSSNLTTYTCDLAGGDTVAWTEEPVGMYEYLTESALDDSRACRHTFAVGEVYVAVHVYDYAEGSGALELWWNSHRLVNIALPLRVTYMQWQGQRLHVSTADLTIVF